MKALLPFLILLFSFVIASADDEKKPNAAAIRRFKGAKAGDAKELVKGISFRWCPAGKFAMGEDDGKASVTLATGFWLAQTEVTQGQWEKLMRTAPWKGEKWSTEGEDYAASYISRDDAVAYCKQLSTDERAAKRLPQGWKYALPSSAQWEYACRAGTQTRFSFGDDESMLSEYAWWGGWQGNGNAQSEKYPHKVGQKKPNPWGLYDMHGNVYELVSDLNPNSNGERRGGGWNDTAATCRSAFRGSGGLDKRYAYVGFRLAAVPE